MNTFSKFKYVLGITAAILVAPVANLKKNQAWAFSLVTQDESEVAAFQSGANVLGFDELPGGSSNQGTPILTESQVTDQFQNLGILFSSEGGPIGVASVEGLPNESDAKSPFNLIGGSTSNNPLPTLNYFSPIEVTFVTPDSFSPNTTLRIGAWNDPTGSRIRLSAFDLNGNLLETAEADEGFFIGISNPSIASARFEFLTIQSANGFSLDDVTFTTPIPTSDTSTPEPSTIIGLLTIGGIALGASKKKLS